MPPSMTMFYGASNVRISGSPNFTMINGGYYHYDHTKKTDKSQSVNVASNDTSFTQNVFNEAPTENTSRRGRRSRAYAAESSLGPTRGARIPHPNVLPTQSLQRFSSNPRIELHPSAQTAPILLSQSSHRRPQTHSGTYNYATYDFSQVQRMDEKTSANMEHLMNALRRGSLTPPEHDDQGLDDNDSNGRPWLREDQGLGGSTDCVSAPVSSGCEESEDSFPYSSPIYPDEDEPSFDPFLSSDESSSAEASYLQDEDEDEDGWNRSNSYGYQQQTVAQQNRPPAVPPHVARILRDLYLTPQHDNIATSPHYR